MSVIVRQIPIESIRADASAQPREHILTDVVANYADDMARGAEFPPLVVFQEGETFWLADGFHRLSAARGVVKRMACEVHRGGLRDAVLYSCGANADHGYRRTNEDKRRAVLKLLSDKEWSHWSDSEIAKRAAVSDFFVGKMRGEHTSNVGSMSPATRTFTHHKTGSPTQMNVTAIGPRKAPVPSDQPEPSPDDAQRAEHTPRRRADELGWVCPMIFEVDRIMRSLPAAQDVADGWPAKQRAALPRERIMEIASWWSALADAWPGLRKEVG